MHYFDNPLKSISQKGSAFLGLGQFDAAKECYESLRTLGDNATADSYLKKLDDVQERDAYNMQHIVLLKVSVQVLDYRK